MQLPIYSLLLRNIQFFVSLSNAVDILLVMQALVILLQLPALSFDESNFSLWGSGEWWMLLAAQSMAVGTVMVRWVSKYSDSVMATGWVCFKSLLTVECLISLC